jgi:DNA-binding PadR family transcriptional regulator
MAKRLTTTSYSLLGLLHLRPFSAYDLTKYMQRSALADLWPRTEAAIYRETRGLAEAGLAHVRTEARGDRQRSVYRITAEGRRAFRSWLQETGGGISFECEPAVKAFFGSVADVATLQAHLASLRDELAAGASAMEPAASRWVVGDLEFPDRIHYTAMAADLIARLQLAVHGWASDWLDRTEGWDDPLLDDAKRAQAHEVIEGIGRDVAARIAPTRRRPPSERHRAPDVRSPG